MTAAAAGPLSKVAGGVPASSSSMSSALGKKADIQAGVGGRVAAASTNWRPSTLSGTRLKTTMAPEGYENGHSSNHKAETRAVASDPKVKTTTTAPGLLSFLSAHNLVLQVCVVLPFVSTLSDLFPKCGPFWQGIWISNSVVQVFPYYKSWLW